MKQHHIPKLLDILPLAALFHLLLYSQWSAPEEPLQMSRHQTCHSVSYK
jgi:hypothetical protein